LSPVSSDQARAGIRAKEAAALGFEVDQIQRWDWDAPERALTEVNCQGMKFVRGLVNFLFFASTGSKTLLLPSTGNRLPAFKCRSQRFARKISHGWSLVAAGGETLRRLILNEFVWLMDLCFFQKATSNERRASISNAWE